MITTLAVAFNLTEVPIGVGTTLGIGTEMAGILLSTFIMTLVLLALAYLNGSTMLIAIGGIGMMFVFTIITWFPVWLTVIASIIGAAVVAGTLSGRSKHQGEG